MSRIPYPVLLALTAAALAAAAVFSLSWGRYPVPLDAVWQTLSGHNADETYQNIIFNLRLPRIAAAMLVGMALSLAGAVYQGIFRNPLVSPDLLGVSSGACVGAAAAVIAGGGLLAVALTLTLPRLIGRDSAVVLVLAGIVVSGFMGATLGVVKYLADPETELAEIVYWQMGSLAKAQTEQLVWLAPVMLLPALLLLLMRWRINVLSLGEREARLVGADTRKERLLMIVCATLLTASAVCISGTIGWLGLVVPHLARMLAGDNNLRSLPLSLLVGALFLLLADTLARNLYTQEIPLGILTGFIGAPFFAWVLVRQKPAD